MDEVGDISLQTQVKLLRLLETKPCRRVAKPRLEHPTSD